MAATGSSMLRTLGIYDKEVAGKPRRRVTLHLIAAPEYIRVVKAQYPDVEIVTVRLDRGLSEEKILGTVPGSHWEKERGLNEHQYIVPGAGGVGELMNNSSA
jgi:uracil phosphoribosyltransferase